MRAALLLVALFFPSICFAGMEKELVCKRCGLKGTYVSGGLMFAGQFVAFCPKDHFVYITWDRDKAVPKPVSHDGKVPVYICPDCKRPIARKWDEKECPRCGSKNIKIKDTGMAVD